MYIEMFVKENTGKYIFYFRSKNYCLDCDFYTLLEHIFSCCLFFLFLIIKSATILFFNTIFLF